MVDQQTGVGVLLSFPIPERTTDNQTDHLIFQLLQSNDSLMTALEHLQDSYNALKVGNTLENADEILTQAESALRQAENVMGHVPVTTTKIQDLRQLSQKQLLLFPAV
jgi:methyl-accepting chemotaxis protein